MTDETDQILVQLEALMQQRNGWKFPGRPYVASEKEFGLQCGPMQSSLTAVHHLVTSLDQAGFFTDNSAHMIAWEPLFAKMPLLTEESVEEETLCQGVVLHRTGRTMTLTIKTEQTPSDIVAALAAGVVAAERLCAQQQQDAEQRARKVEEEFARESAKPLFGRETEETLIKAYLTAKADAFFPGNTNAEANGPYVGPRMNEDTYVSPAQFEERRPRFELRFAKPEEEADAAELFLSAMKQVFTAPGAVEYNLERRARTALYLNVYGNPTRLVWDVIEKDYMFGRKIAQDLGISKGDLLPHRDRQSEQRLTRVARMGLALGGAS